MKKILVIGPDPIASKGGMAAVIDGIAKDKELNKEFDIEIYGSYVDGNKLKVLLFSLFSFIRFYFTKRNYDIYHIHVASYGSTFRKGLYVKVAKKWGKKVILHIHGGEYLLFYENSNKKDKIRSIINAADMVIVLSSWWKSKFDEIFGLTNCVVLENGVDTESLKLAITDNYNNLRTFISLGRLGESKGTYDLIDAIEQVKEDIPDIKCYLAGDGEIEKSKELIRKKKLEDNIIVTGWIDLDKKISFLKDSSTLVLPAYNEGLPMSILEAMACGKAIISTKVGAIPEVIKKENGILIEPGDINALTMALKTYCMNEKEVKKVGKENIKIINQKYNIKVMHQKLSKYYHNVIN